MNAEPTKKKTEPNRDGQMKPDLDPDMRDEYDFRGGVRGKYAQRLTGSIRREMVPEHAREMWDAEKAAYGELVSRPQTQTEIEL